MPVRSCSPVTRVAVQLAPFADKIEQGQVSGRDLVTLWERWTRLHAERVKDSVILVVAGRGLQREVLQETGFGTSDLFHHASPVGVREPRERRAGTFDGEPVEAAEIFPQGWKEVACGLVNMVEHIDIGRGLQAG